MAQVERFGCQRECSEMATFHRWRDIRSRFGRMRTKSRHYGRWCFFEPAVADALIMSVCLGGKLGVEICQRIARTRKPLFCTRATVPAQRLSRLGGVSGGSWKTGLSLRSLILENWPIKPDQ